MATDALYVPDRFSSFRSAATRETQGTLAYLSRDIPKGTIKISPMSDFSNKVYPALNWG